MGNVSAWVAMLIARGPVRMARRMRMTPRPADGRATRRVFSRAYCDVLSRADQSPM